MCQEPGLFRSLEDSSRISAQRAALYDGQMSQKRAKAGQGAMIIRMTEQLMRHKLRLSRRGGATVKHQIISIEAVVK